jgi:hypothetical protein
MHEHLASVDEEIQANSERQVEGPDHVLDHVIGILRRQVQPERGEFVRRESGGLGQFIQSFFNGDVVESRNP